MELRGSGVGGPLYMYKLFGQLIGDYYRCFGLVYIKMDPPKPLLNAIEPLLTEISPKDFLYRTPL